jgi:acyl-coenzyme A synthetase/AMP-(fatty) acid ligase
VYPRRIFFRDVLPKNPVGKIIRRELRDEAPEDFYTKI